jgi:enoyl-CoA hydratase/carnithine racemase
MPRVTVEPRGNIGIARLTHGVTSPIGPELVEDLRDAVRRIGSEYRGLMLAGGDKFFSIGFDLPNLLQLDRKGMFDFFHGFGDLLLELATLPIPTATAVRGHAVAGGTILMLTTDFRIAASGRTLVGLNESRLGVPVPYAADLLLRLLVRDRAATTIMYRGELVEASSVEAVGLVDRIAPREEVEETAVAMIVDLAALPPASFAVIKEHRMERFRERYGTNGRARNEQFLDIWFQPDTRERLAKAAESF